MRGNPTKKYAFAAGLLTKKLLTGEEKKRARRPRQSKRKVMAWISVAVRSGCHTRRIGAPGPHGTEEGRGGVLPVEGVGGERGGRGGSESHGEPGPRETPRISLS